jgi:drug/metabolite transporter superfamily protein YnfA
MTLFIPLMLLAAAFLEVGGDAVIRLGLRGSRPSLVVCGMVLLALYGVAVNQVRWDFGRLLGVYVAVFATVSVLAGRLVFAEHTPLSTWLGLVLILTGGAVLQFGPR